MLSSPSGPVGDELRRGLVGDGSAQPFVERLQQVGELVGDDVSRDDLRAGDLLFFPGHVAISLGGVRYVHAHGDSSVVVVNSLDHAADDYLAEHDEGLACCRRLLTGTA